MIASVARPSSTRTGVGELVRTWTPAGAPDAEVVIIHGLGEHSGRYERTGSILAEAGLGVTSFDLVGCGASGGPRAYLDDWASYLDQVEGHIAAVGHPVVLLGHSLGGLIALDYTLSDRPPPDLLVLSAPALVGGKTWQRALAPMLAKIAPKLAIPNAITGDQLSRDPAVGEAYLADPLVTRKSTTRLGSEIFAAIDRVNATVKRLDVRTLVLHGGADTVVPAASSASLAGLATVERRLYPKLRHEVFNEPEGPDVVAEVVVWIRSGLTSE